MTRDNRLRSRFIIIALAGTLQSMSVIGCSRDDSSQQPAMAAARTSKTFVDVAKSAGINHRHHKPVLDRKLDNIMPWVSSVGAAAAAGDFDRDGWLDLYVTNSHKGTPNYLYQNNRDGTFTDVGKAAGVADVNNDGGTSMDCIWGDVDNDGWPDLYVVRWGTDRLFHNNGDGTFTDVTSQRFQARDGSAGTQWANGNAAVFLDYNLDGRLDIYVGNYFQEIDLWNLQSTKIMHDSFEVARNAGSNFLYRQNADGTFTETAEKLGVDDRGWTLAVGSADINNDGWPDLYCADDFGPDQVFINTGDGGFTNVSDQAIGPDTKKGMNVDFGDFNNDGWLDIYVTNITTAEYLQEGNMLWYNNGPGPDGVVTFTDIAAETNTYDGGWGWGGKFVDYDNDGDLDIFTVNGFISAGEGNFWYDLASWTVLGQDASDAANWPAIGERSFSGYEANRFWRNDGLESFSQRASEVGLDSDRDGRGIVCFDYDNDGDVDIYVANHDQAPHLFRNDGGGGGHWLTVILQTDSTTETNPDAIGARVTLVTDKHRQFRERDGGNGYAGQSDPRLHFGLGQEDTVRLLEVRWPDGGLQYLENVPANRFVTVRQDPNHYAAKAIVQTGIPKARPRRTEQPRREAAPVDAKELQELLSVMESTISQNPADHTLAYRYRQTCVEHEMHDRAIGFFDKLVSQNSDDIWPRIELSAAYIDKIPTCGGLAAIVSKGTLARKALDQLDVVVGKNDRLWVGYYARGMNHLHWPRALRHSDDAAADFERCLTIQREDHGASAKTFHVRTFILLGDAYAKNKSYSEARKAWRDGLRDFPDSKLLKDRLAIGKDDDLLEFVENARSLEDPIDTDFSFVDGE